MCFALCFLPAGAARCRCRKDVCSGADCDCVCVCPGPGYELPGDWRRIALDVGHVLDRAMCSAWRCIWPLLAQFKDKCWRNRHVVVLNTVHVTALTLRPMFVYHLGLSIIFNPVLSIKWRCNTFAGTIYIYFFFLKLRIHRLYHLNSSI